MPLIIDGYNLLHASGILGRGLGPGGLERSRRALLNFLIESLPERELSATVVVFDAAANAQLRSRQTEHRGLAVFFAAAGECADDLIERLIATHATPRRLTVVSSDHRLHRAARRRRAVAVDSDIWFAQMVRSRRERSAAASDGAEKPSDQLSEVEIQFWLRQFGQPMDPADEQLTAAYRESTTPELDEPTLSSEQDNRAAIRGRHKPAWNEKHDVTSDPNPGKSEVDIARRNPFPPGYAEDIDPEEYS